MHERHRAVGENLDSVHRVALEERAAIATRLQSQPPVLASNVRRHLIEFATRRVATSHRIVRNDVDAAADVFRGNRLRRPLNGCGRLREHNEEQRNQERTSR